MRRTLAILLFLGAGLTTMVAGASPASADGGADGARAAACSYRDDIYLNSGVTEAWASLWHCGSHYEVDGMVCDTSDDGRTAFLDLRKNGESGSPSQRVQASGPGTCGSATFTFPLDTSRVWARTRACATSCSSQASGYLYA